MPRVTVVITCFNYGAYLEQAARSVLDQTFGDLEVLIVDDGSTDDSLAVARAVAACDPRVEVLAQENSGQPAIPRNRAIERAGGEYVVCLDADDLLEPEMVARCAAVLDGEPLAGMANPQLQEFDGGDVRHRQHDWSVETLRRGNVYPCTTMFRRAAWAAAGGYSTNVRGYEDWDLWLGIAEAGWEARPAPGALFFYRRHGTGVYAQATGRDLDLKAQVVLNRAGLYTDAQVAWARGVLAGEPRALAVEHAFGFVPDLRDPAGPVTVSRDRRARTGWHLLAEGELESPFPGRSLAEALTLVDRLGYTAVRCGDALAARKRATDPVVFPVPFFGADAGPAQRAAALGAALEHLAGAGALRHAVVDHRARRAGSELNAARRVAILAFGDELVAEPDLLTAYATAVDDGDDVTLVVATTDAGALVAAVGAAGLNGAGSPDMLAVAGVPAGVDAIFSRRPGAAGAPRFDDTSLDALRALARAA
jgi:hypothetical protein